jgi:hypothetical protein
MRSRAAKGTRRTGRPHQEVSPGEVCSLIRTVVVGDGGRVKGSEAGRWRRRRRRRRRDGRRMGGSNISSRVAAVKVPGVPFS